MKLSVWSGNDCIFICVDSHSHVKHSNRLNRCDEQRQFPEGARIRKESKFLCYFRSTHTSQGARSITSFCK